MKPEGEALVFQHLPNDMLPSAETGELPHKTVSFSDHSPNKIIQASDVHLCADPLRIPGPETFSGDLEILRNISGNHIRLDVAIEKHILFTWLDMPCIPASGQQVGSW